MLLIIVTRTGHDEQSDGCSLSLSTKTVALTCDVKGMFHQFFVDEEYRDLLRFFWWDQGDLKKKSDEYHIKVHLFGAASSPGCANYGFKKAADDGEKEFGTSAYVHNGLKSVKDVNTAIDLIQKTQGMCARAGLRLDKFGSSKKEVIQAVASEDRAKGLQDLDLTRDPLPIERTLGIMWCAETDSFQFRIVIQDRPLRYDKVDLGTMRYSVNSMLSL